MDEKIINTVQNDVHFCSIEKAFITYIYLFSTMRQSIQYILSEKILPLHTGILFYIFIRVSNISI